jgi:hypothetical protein
MVGIGNGQPIVVIDIDVAQIVDRGLNLGNPLSGRKEGDFIGVIGDQNNHPFK